MLYMGERPVLLIPWNISAVSMAKPVNRAIMTKWYSVLCLFEQQVTLIREQDTDKDVIYLFYRARDKVNVREHYNTIL